MLDKIQQIMRSNRPFIARALVSAVLWILLIVCFITSIRTNILTDVAIAHIKDKTVTPAQIDEERKACEAAKDFAQAWSTFDSDREAYARKLKNFGVITGYPEGIQRCNSISVISAKKVSDKKSLYRIVLKTEVSRLMTLTEDSPILPPNERIVERQKTENGEIITYWKDFEEVMEISVQVERDGEIKVLGTPVAKPKFDYSAADPKSLIGSTEVPEDFKTFAAQALSMYYEGQKMDNFVCPGVTINPVGGYTVEEVNITAFSRKDEAARAIAAVKLSAEGITHIEQSIVIEANKEERWLLVRVGSY